MPGKKLQLRASGQVGAEKQINLFVTKLPAPGAAQRYSAKRERVALAKQSGNRERIQMEPLPRIFSIRGCDQVLIAYCNGHTKICDLDGTT
jgi:hypothetical protein